MPRTELIRRLVGLDPPTPAACFVLLWTYFRHDEVGLSAAEDRVRAIWGHVLRLPSRDLSGDPADGRLRVALKELQTRSGEELDVLALQILKGLDLVLIENKFSDFDYAELTGIDGGIYTVRSRNHFLASRWGITWARRQGLSLAAYCNRFMAVPSHPVQGLRIESRPKASWGTSYLQNRLYDERERLRIMLWPFRCSLDYPAFQEMEKKPPPLHVRLDEMRNESVLQEEVRSALAEARKEKVTLLILPELSIPPATEAEIRRVLAGQGMSGYPILTLFGCPHRRNSNLFAVPSLSPKTSAHQTAANALQPRTLASTFVCNHWNDEPPSHRSTSFYQLPARDGRRFHILPDSSKADRPYLLFDLATTKR